MDIIEAIFLLASNRLRTSGVLWLEVDPSHPAIIQNYLVENSDLQLKFVASYQDMFQKERFVEIVKV